jgi:hypothetical protein
MKIEQCFDQAERDVWLYAVRLLRLGGFSNRELISQIVDFDKDSERWRAIRRNRNLRWEKGERGGPIAGPLNELIISILPARPSRGG